MPIFKISGKTILFLHIPKAGGTSVEECLAGFSSQSFRMHHNTGDLPCVPQHFHGDLMSQLFTKDFFDYSFCVTRNPYARILSEYNYRMQHRHRPYRWLPAPKFDVWLKATLLRYKRNGYVYSNHIRPQVAFRLPATRWFRLEDQIGALMAELADLTSVELPEVLPHANPSNRRHLFISSGAAKLIYDFYQEDFETFGYAQDSYKHF